MSLEVQRRLLLGPGVNGHRHDVVKAFNGAVTLGLLAPTSMVSPSMYGEEDVRTIHVIGIWWLRG